MLVEAVVVAGDGAGADIGAGADLGVADIGQMIDLGAGVDQRRLGLDEVADLARRRRARCRAAAARRGRPRRLLPMLRLGDVRERMDHRAVVDR